MRIQYSELANSIRLIKLSGALDIHGVRDVEVDFVRLCMGENICILVDLSKVNYISSIGIPLLINSAKSITRQGGKMALLSPQKSVEDILELTGIPLMIPIYQNLNVAVSELKK
jgi:anti-sigma B factor antagonist